MTNGEKFMEVFGVGCATYDVMHDVTTIHRNGDWWDKEYEEEELAEIEQLRADRDRLEKALDEIHLSIDRQGGWKYKWIPFEEEIPEQGVHILVTTTAGIVTMAFVDSNITEKLRLRMIDPISYRLVEVDNPKEYNITHWAKMPEEYKGEG